MTLTAISITLLITRNLIVAAPLDLRPYSAWATMMVMSQSWPNSLPSVVQISSQQGAGDVGVQHINGPYVYVVQHCEKQGNGVEGSLPSKTIYGQPRLIAEISIGNVQDSEMGIEIKIKQICLTFY